MRVLLDLGLPKTGSKSRQRFFERRSHGADPPTLLYPSSGREGCWHRPLHEALKRSDRNVLDRVVREVRDRGAQADLVVLSYERLWELGPTQIRWLRDALPRLTAVIFLRRQDQLVSSRHNQLHKSHRVSLAELESFEARMLDYDPALDYRRLLERWCAVLGRKAIVPIVYQKSTSAVETFFRHAGIEIPLHEDEEPWANPAVDGFGLAVFRWVKRLALDERELPCLMERAHSRLASHFLSPHDRTPRYSLTLAQRRRIVEPHQHSNAWVAREFFPDRDGLFSPLEPGELLLPEDSDARALAEAIVEDARR